MLGSVGTQAAELLGMTDEADALVGPPEGAVPWSSRLPTGTLATDAVSLASLAIELVRAARTGAAPSPVVVQRPRVAASFGSERLIRLDGAAPDVWAPLSGFWRGADGWVRTHGNYPHHDAALRALLHVGPAAPKDEVSAAMAARSTGDLEDHAAESGAIVARVRTAKEWAEHPQGRAVAASPLIAVTRTDGAAPRSRSDAAAPLAGVRVLDLTRVIAGPVAARDLALAGADVLRVDSPALEETGWIHLDTGQGKRSTLLDLGDSHDRACFDALLSSADVVVTGYRPGALTRFGLDADELAARFPGIVTASVSAWGTTGPWASRRGFDSIVQAATGIALAESRDGATPGALPVQALDHSTGHLLAASVVRALAAQRRDGGSIDVRMSLARVAHALLAATDAAPPVDPDLVLPTVERHVGAPDLGTLTCAPPVLAFTGAPDDYPAGGGRWGADAPVWRDDASPGTP